MRQNVKEWAKNNIKWAGNQNTNKSDRRRYIPEIIVNHITEGTAQSCINWFTNSSNKDSSAHFLIAKDGQVYQFVAIEDNAWANGAPYYIIDKSTSKIVKNRQSNPNWYSISKEHEGVYKDTKGKLTDAQLYSSMMVDAYIIDYVKDTWGTDILLNRDYILGHCEINPIEKPNCPGKLFPYDKIIERLRAMVDQRTVSEDIDIITKFVPITKDYWVQHARVGSNCNGGYVQILLRNLANYFSGIK